MGVEPREFGRGCGLAQDVKISINISKGEPTYISIRYPLLKKKSIVSLMNLQTDVCYMFNYATQCVNFTPHMTYYEIPLTAC